MPGDETMDPALLCQPQFPTESWELDQDLSIFNGLMVGIPVPGDA
jgi:hypothetical protein